MSKPINETPITTDWITASNDGNGCVEMRRVGTEIQLRDTKTQDVQSYNLLEIDHFLQGAKDGVFDGLVY